MMQTLWQQWTSEIAKQVSQVLGETVDASEVVVPPDTKLGDFAVACFKYAKMKGMNPAALANELVEKLQASRVENMSFVAAGPYVNVLLEASSAVKRVVTEVSASGVVFGSVAVGEGSSPRGQRSRRSERLRQRPPVVRACIRRRRT